MIVDSGATLHPLQRVRVALIPMKIACNVLVIVLTLARCGRGCMRCLGHGSRWLPSKFRFVPRLLVPMAPCSWVLFGDCGGGGMSQFRVIMIGMWMWLCVGSFKSTMITTGFLACVWIPMRKSSSLEFASSWHL